MGEITPHPALTPNIRVLCECIARSKGELFLSLAQVLPPRPGATRCVDHIRRYVR